MSPADEAKEHLAQAEKALKPSFWALKFSPDHLTASMEFTQAATKFRAAGLSAESVHSWTRAAEAKEQIHDLFGAGRSYESAGAICDGRGPGGPPAAARHWEKAIRCFRLCDKGDIAAKLLIKLAELREKEEDTAGAKEAFDEAIEVFQQDEKDYNLTDVFKQYIGFLVRSRLFDDASRAIDGHIEVLTRQRHFSFVHKEILSKVVIFLFLRDTVRAEEALNPRAAGEGWYTSKEFQLGAELVAAFQVSDAEAAAQLLREQTFMFLQVEVARLVKQLHVPVVGPRRGMVAEGADAAGEAAEPVDVADLLM